MLHWLLVTSSHTIAALGFVFSVRIGTSDASSHTSSASIFPCAVAASDAATSTATATATSKADNTASSPHSPSATNPHSHACRGCTCSGTPKNHFASVRLQCRLHRLLPLPHGQVVSREEGMVLCSC